MRLLQGREDAVTHVTCVTCDRARTEPRTGPSSGLGACAISKQSTEPTAGLGRSWPFLSCPQAQWDSARLAGVLGGCRGWAQKARAVVGWGPRRGKNLARAKDRGGWPPPPSGPQAAPHPPRLEIKLGADGQGGRERCPGGTGCRGPGGQQGAGAEVSGEPLRRPLSGCEEEVKGLQPEDEAEAGRGGGWTAAGVARRGDGKGEGAGQLPDGSLEHGAWRCFRATRGTRRCFWATRGAVAGERGCFSERGGRPQRPGSAWGERSVHSPRGGQNAAQSPQLPRRAGRGPAVPAWRFRGRAGGRDGAAPGRTGDRGARRGLQGEGRTRRSPTPQPLLSSPKFHGRDGPEGRLGGRETLTCPQVWRMRPQPTPSP